MKNKRLTLENEIYKFIKNKPDANPYIDLSDITSHLFLMCKIGQNPKHRIMVKKWRAKKNHAKSIIKILLAKKLIKIDNIGICNFMCS